MATIPRARLACFTAAVVLAAAQPLGARDIVVGELRIEHPYARATPPGARTAAAYLAIENRGREPDRLVGARSPLAAAVELHSMREEGGVMRMRQLREVRVPPGQTRTLPPGRGPLMIIY